MVIERPTSPLHRLQPRRQWVTIGLAVAIVALLVWVVWDNTRSDRQAEVATEQAELSAANAEIIARQIHDACERQDEVAEQLGDICQQAEQIAEEPAEPAVVAPTDEQLRPLVQEYTEAWLVRNPPRNGQDGRTPTAAEIADVAAGEVARQLAEDPPEDGRTPTAAEIRPIVEGVVADYLSANPPPPGEDGADGTDGRDGTDGKPGQDGTDGVDGADGEPPMSWRFTHQPVIGPPTTYECTRDASYTPEAPTYQCEPVED